MGSIQKEWLVYFFEPAPHRYTKLTKLLWKHKPGFAHVGALSYDSKHDLWQHIQYTHAGICTDIITPEEARELLSRLYGYKILICPQKEDYQFLRLKEITCVTFMMRLIGFYRAWVFTPYQLYCALRKAGYKSFWSKTS